MLKDAFCCAFLIALIGSGQISRAQNLNGFDISDSTIPTNEIRRGGPPRDGIPSIDTPKFASSNVSIKAQSRVLGVFVNGIAKAYPVLILNYHEIVNDDFDGAPVVITYCPLCGSGAAFEAEIDEQKYTFGVSGLLYNSDVLMYDRETNSLWSQLMSEAVSGPKAGAELVMLPTSNTNWGEWKKRYPQTLVLSDDTGFTRNYSRTPYQGYDESESLYFPVNNVSSKYHSKEKILGITLNGVPKAYPFSELRKVSSPLTDMLAEKEIQVLFDSHNDTAIITDMNGAELPHITTFWFAWYAFNPKTEIFKAK